MPRVFRSVKAFEEAMFPEETRRKKLAAMTPEELGKYMADEALEKVRQKLAQREEHDDIQAVAASS